MKFEKLLRFFETTRTGKVLFAMIIVAIVVIMLCLSVFVFIWDHVFKEAIKELLTDEIPSP